MQLDLNSLEALEAVVKYGGFARAAEHLHKVQSAVSHQVRKIERQLRERRVSLAQLQEHVELSVQHSSEEQDYDRHLFGCERAFYLSSLHTKKEASCV